MSSFDFIDVNNAAIGLLQQGDCAAAMTNFLTALDLFKAQVAASHWQEQLNLAQLHSHKRVDSVTHQMCMGVGTYDDAIDDDEDDDCFFQSVSFGHHELEEKTATSRLHLYSRAFSISDLSQHDPCAKNRRDGTAALILFNIAVAMHAQAVKARDNQTLMRSLVLYRMAFSSVEQWDMTSCGGDMKRCLLRMSILNNLAWLGSHFMQAKETVACLEELRRMIKTIDALDPEYLDVNDPDPEDLDPEDREVFDSNIMLFIEQPMDISPAPAA